LDQGEQVSRDLTLQKDSLWRLVLFKFENVEGQSLINDESRQYEGGHTTPDLGLQRKVKGRIGLKTWRRSRSLIEEGVVGPLIWLRMPKSRRGRGFIDSKDAW
jgi:hypothetical protein